MRTPSLFAVLPLVALGALLAAGSAVAGLDPVVCIDEGAFDEPARAPAVVELDAGLDRAVFEGATPPGLDPARPVIVFVHGLGGRASGWWSNTNYHGHNDMYDAAYEAGYKTFFVDLLDVGGESGTGVENGRLLKQQIDWIVEYWGVDEVNVVGHSKGGVDANIAGVLGAPIDTLVGLSAPFHGSPLADLAQTDWLDWLAELLGVNDAGTKFLQTGCMDEVRTIADARPQDGVSIFTAAATGWGPFLSALEFGGLYLAATCPGTSNDGLVCVEHAKHPLGRNAQEVVDGEHRLVWDSGGPYFELDHDNIRKGSAFFDFFWWWEPDDCYIPVFESIEPYVGSFHGAFTGEGVRPASSTEPRATPLDLIVRGGPVTGRATESFAVEPGVERIALRALVADAETRVAWIGPDGVRHDAPVGRRNTGGPFAGAITTGVVVDAPRAGSWRLVVESQRADAYAMVAHLDGGVDLEVVDGRGGDEATIVGDAVDLQIEMRTHRVSTGDRAPWEVASRSSDRRFTPPHAGPGVFSSSLTITGRTPGRVAFRAQPRAVAPSR